MNKYNQFGCGYDEAARNSWKNYIVALLIGFGLGTGGWFYLQKRHKELDKPPVKTQEPYFEYFSIEAMIDGVGYDISKPLPPNVVPSVYYAVIRNRRLGGGMVEFRRPVNPDAVEGLQECIERLMRSDRKVAYEPSEYRALIEKLPDLDSHGDYRTITKGDVMKAYNRASGGLKAIISE
jgi:hypothetical protein